MGQPTTVIPTLETARLRLRAHRVDDLPACIAMWGDAEVTRHIGGRPFTREETWGRVLRYAGHWALLGYGYWVLEELASRRFAGEIGFSDFKRDLPMDLGGAPEIGWALATWAHGQGFANEAVSYYPTASHLFQQQLYRELSPGDFAPHLETPAATAPKP